MINDGINNVPEKTIAIFQYPETSPIKDRLSNIISKPDRKRDWFHPHFYRCLPLSVANQYGFVITSEYDFSVEWDGSDEPGGVKIEVEGETSHLFPEIESGLGHGTVTFNPPFILRTPPGVNLLTMAPPNHILYNIMVMSGVVETDNLRRNFSFSIKLQIPGIKTFFPKGTPIAAFIPIPRYYADGFDLVMADELFSDEVLLEEEQAGIDASLKRTELEGDMPNRVGRDYFLGKDVYENKFNDHQLP